MNKISQTVILSCTLITTLFAGANNNFAPGSLQELSNYLPAPDYKNIVQEQSSVLESRAYDKTLGAAPFLYVRRELANKVYVESDLSDPKEISGRYLMALYPEVSIEGFTQHSAHKKLRNTANLRYMAELKNGVKIAKYTQQVDGIDVYAREYNVLLNADNEVVASTGYLAEKMPKTNLTRAPFAQDTMASKAIEFAVADILGTPYAVTVSEQESSIANERQFKAEHAIANIDLNSGLRVKQVWFDNRAGLVPAYYVEISGQEIQNKEQFAFAHIVAETDGEILSRINLVSRESYTYRVFSDNPSNKKLLDGPQGHEWPIVGNSVQEVFNAHNRQVASSSYVNISLEAGPISTGDPWLVSGATTTNGNNVHAYLDIDSVDGFSAADVIAETTSLNTFDYVFAADANANDGARKSAVVNLFYMNNWLHDWFYDSGFDELAGNAQVNNYGRGGAGGDVLLAEGQDSSGRNNANMFTPSDGVSPQMQMFLYDGSAVQGETFDLNLTGISGLNNPIAELAAYGPQIFASLTANVVRYEDGVAAPSVTDACEVPTNAADIAGNIALVDRGDCNFTVKVKNAQNAGAVAVLVANNIDGNVVVPMGGDDLTVTIPSLMITQNDGATIQQALANNLTVSATLYRNEVTDLDGTFDNAIIAHEWGHYISNRLVGNSSGLGNSQGRGMGEGWGDFLALLTFANESDALVLGNDQYQGMYPMFGWVDQDPYFGIRRVPYTTDLGLNALSFKHIEEGVALPIVHPVSYGADGSVNAEVHATGEIWATMLWEVYTALINDSRYSFSQAQEKMKDYLVAGLKLTPVAPTFTEARDALLAVAYASDQADLNLMINAFAKRGLGLGAVSPDRFSETNSGVVESLTTDKSSFALADINLDASAVGFCSDDNILDAGESAFLNISLSNNGFADISDLPVQVSTTADVTLQNNGQINLASLPFGQTEILSLGVTLNSATNFEHISFDISFTDVAGTLEPTAASETIAVHYTLESDLDRTGEDFETVILTEHDWEYAINPALTADVSLAEDAINVFSSSTFNSNVLYIKDLPIQADISLVSPELSIGTDPLVIGFQHYFDFESGSWDGGVIEISINGGVWQDVTLAGGTFATGYNGIIATNPDSPINQRNAFVNIKSGGPETLTFDSSLNNSSVQIRFRMGADANTGGYGWEIDNINFTGLINRPFSKVGVETQTCNGSNQAPIAMITNNLIQAEVGAVVTLDASASTDADNDTLTYTWVQTSGTLVTLLDPNSVSTTFTAPDITSDETLEFTVTVSDGVLESTAASVVNVNAPNQAPVAIIIEFGIEAESGENVFLDASADSSDPDGDTLQFSWVQIAGPNVVLDDPNNGIASFIAPEVTSSTVLTFEVTVSDGQLSDTAQSSVTVIPKNRAPIASVATTSISVVEGGNVELDASSSSDPDGDSVAYSWSQTSGTSVSLSNSSSAIASFTAPQVSASTNLGFQVVVTDGPLESSANVTVTVTNQATTTPPTTTTPPATGGGGGGSIGYFGLLFLMLIAYRRRETAAKITR